MECSVSYAIYVIAHICASTKPVPIFSPSKIKSTVVSMGLPLLQYVNRGVESRYVVLRCIIQADVHNKKKTAVCCCRAKGHDYPKNYCRTSHARV